MSAPTVPLSTAEKIHSRGPRQSVMSRAAAMLIMGVFTLYFLTPIWWLLVTSTKSGSEITGTAALWFTPNSISTFFTNLIGLFQYQDGLFVKW